MKNVIVTGAGKGLGLEVARRLMQDGFRVIGIGRTLTPAYSTLMKTVGNDDTKFHTYDLENVDGIPGLVKTIESENGVIFGLVNNAAIGVDGVLATMHQSDIARALKVNLEAPILLAKSACRSMLRQRDGRIVNVSSIVATTGFNGLSVYGASKAGLVGFTKSLARELGRVGITVNCLAPGFMATEMTAGLQDSQLESIRRRSPMGLAEPSDAASAIAFLLSDDASRMTGSTVTVDGGSTA